MIMTVDTGNKMIKTDTLEFNAGVEILDQMPGEREEVILYEGQYLYHHQQADFLYGGQNRG